MDLEHNMETQEGRRIEDAAQIFAEQALSQPAHTQRERAQNVAKFMLTFHAYAKQRDGDREGELAQVLRRITDPKEALPRIVEKVGQVLQLLREDAPERETVYLSRSMLGDAMRMLGREDLIP